MSVIKPYVLTLTVNITQTYSIKAAMEEARLVAAQVGESDKLTVTAVAVKAPR
jgi:hypothetical protein